MTTEVIKVHLVDLVENKTINASIRAFYTFFNILATQDKLAIIKSLYSEVVLKTPISTDEILFSKTARFIELTQDEQLFYNRIVTVINAVCSISVDRNELIKDYLKVGIEPIDANSGFIQYSTKNLKCIPISFTIEFTSKSYKV